MAELCENRCENCDKVDRGFDDCSHMIHFISDRCPLYEMLKIRRQVTGDHNYIEWTTCYTGCHHFVLDEEYKKQNEETEKIIAEMHEKWRKEGK